MPTPEELSAFIAGASTPPEVTSAAEVVPPIELTSDQKEMKELHKNIVACQEEYKGESNIPLRHDYWIWQNQYRALANKGK